MIPNAPDPAVFNASGRVELRPGEPVRLITTSWSDNPRKGADVIAELERGLDPARFQLTFVGRSPVDFQHARVVPPVPSAEVARLLREHHIFVFASLNEACSNSLLEALACGVPALYVDSGSNAEVVGGGGLPFRDAAEAADAPRRARRALGRAAGGHPRAVAGRDCGSLPRGAAPVKSASDFVRPVASPVRRWAIEARTKSWRDHSRLFVAGDGNDWAIADDARQIARVAARLGAQVGSESWVSARARPVRLPREPVRAARPAVRAERQPARRRVPPRPPGDGRDAGVRHVLRGCADAARGARPDPGALAGDGGARAGGGRARGEGLPHPDRHRPRALHAAHS